MKAPIRKRRTREHVIADLSINFVERQALLCGYAVERIIRDYGIDLEIITVSRAGEVQEGKIFLQVKASLRLRIRSGTKAFPFRIDRRDLVSWMAQPMPVILTVYDAKNDVAYWLYVQSYFRKQRDFNLFAAGKTVTLQMETANVLDRQAMRTFARFRDRVLEQMQEVVHDED